MTDPITDHRTDPAAGTALHELADRDARGRLVFRAAMNDHGELVLCRGEDLPSRLRPLDTAERVALAVAERAQPALVVTNPEGDHVALIDDAIDLERHVPINPDEAELLSAGAWVRFGRRDDDLVALSAWADDDLVRIFDPDHAEFADVAVLELREGDLVVHRGEVPAALRELVVSEIAADAGEGTRYGLLTNPFGDTFCAREGAAVMPHEDVRQQSVISGEGLLEGVETLGEAAQRLRVLAERLERAEADGWQLLHQVLDGLAVAERA